MSKNILIVDDEDDIRMLIGGILSDEGYTIREANNSETAFEALRTKRPDIVILDIWLEGSKLDGLDILSEINKEYPYLPVVMISGHGNIETAVAAIKKGAYDYIEKPFKSDRLLLIVERAIENANLKRENIELKQRFSPDEDLIGFSAIINAVRKNIELVAPTNSRVLITGEQGSGKEVAARLIHKLSRRKNNPFVVINCAGMHPERMELELFGKEKSDNDISDAKTGFFEQAHGGTLLLDEVADMPIETQGKIVRVLQEQTFFRVGGNKKIEVDVRVIATSNRNLQEAIRNNKFREDLFYRLNVVPIKMPSLKERKDDIPKLAEYFMRKSNNIANENIKTFAEDALMAMQSYDWPGNVRQLKNIIDWILIMSSEVSGNQITINMLPSEIYSAAPKVFSWDKKSEIMSLPIREARDMFEKEYLLAKLARCGDNISETARQVEMERSALHRKLKMLGIIGDK
ncbi:MAG: sigma-54-dependent transcriptional regulator [Alphaproteobacteria bacterium]